MTVANIAYGVQFIVVVLTILLKGPVIRAKAPMEHDFLLVTAPDAGDIYNVDLNEMLYEIVHLEIKNYPLRIDYDPVQRRMYWTDPVAREIRSADLNGIDNRLLYGWRKGAKLNGIAVDPLSRLVFYTDSGNNVIGFVTISSFEHKILINSDLDKPADIALDTQNGVMFWTETGNAPRIVRANYDGSSRVTIVDTSIIKPMALMLDMTEKLLYWSDPGRQRIERSSLTGQDRTTVFKPADITYLTGMVVHEEIVYFTDTKNDKDTGNPDGKVYMYLSGDFNKLVTIKGTPFDIHVYSMKSSIKGPNGCGNDNGGCSHICIPTVNNKTKCMCPDRRSLRADEKTCGSDISLKEFMLVTASGNGDIYYMDLKTLNYKRIPADVHTSPLAIDYNPQDGHIYWTDLDDEEIRSISLDGREGRLLRGWAKHAILNGIAIDSHSGLLFYTDDLNDVIGLVMIESLEHKFVISINLKNPRAIVLDSENGFIFWSDLGTFPRIERANYDGSGRNTIVQAELQYPNALALDVYEKWLYWADSGTHQIERCDFTGRHRTTIFQGFTSNFFFGLALQTDQLYFIDWTADGEKTKQSYVHRINTDGTNSTLLFSALGRMNDIHLFSTFSYNTEIRNACDDNNGDCSHICIPISPRNRKCLCPDGGSLKIDGKTCTSNKIQQEFMLLAASNPGNFFSLDLTTFIYKSIPSEVQAQPSAIDYDPLDDRIYWTDVTNKEIRSALLNGSDTRLVRGWGERAVLGDIAVDPLSRLVFYTDNGNDIIGVITVSDFEHKLLIGRDLDKPGAIVLDTLKGVMFWSAWGDKPKIERSNYDGSDRKVIVQTSLLLPLAMVLDITENCLYWTDSRKGRIEKSTLTGQLRTTVFQASSDIFLGLGLAVYDQHLYFTDWTVSKAENKVSYLRYVHTSGSKGAAIKAISGRLNGIHVHSSPAYPRESNGCGDYNGGCSHICFPTSRSSRKCACPDGQSLKANERTCAIDSAKQDFLIVTAQNTGNMYQIDLKTLSLQRMPVAIQMYPTAIDYDPVGDRIYWADVSDKEIRSAFLNGTDNRILREWENRAKVADIAVDPISRLVFYTDDGNDVIGLVTIARSEHRLLVSTNLGKPKAIVLHTQDGIMFWSDCGDEPKIERANYDGSDRSAVVYTSLVSPVALALDTDGNVLYWTDSGAERLERSNLVGQDRTVIYESLSHKVFSALAFHGRHLYFTEWTMLESGEEVSHVHRINTNGEGSSTVFSTSDSLNDIYVHSATLHKKDPQGCGDNNGGCSHICIPSLELISMCLCPDGMTLMPDTVTCAFYIHGDEL